MKFSFVVPVYNVELYLEECVNSIICQSDIEKEIILVDDGSTDNSGNVCDRLSLSNNEIRVIHKTNGGLSDARNVGLLEATGDYIAFVDSDDYIEKNCVCKVKMLIENNNNPDVIFMKRISFIEGKDVCVYNDEGFTSEVNELREDDLYQYFASLKKYPASACIKIIKHSFLVDNNMFFEKGLLSEDLEWGMRFFLKISSAAFYTGNYYYYRTKRTGSITNSVGEKNVLDVFETFKKGVELAKVIDRSAQRLMIMSFTEYIFRIIVLYFDQLSRTNQHIVKEEIKKATWILNHRRDMPSKIIYYVYSLFGMSVANRLVKLYLKGREV